MSLCATLKSNKRATCDTVSGGIAQILLFDPADFTWDLLPSGGIAPDHYDTYHQFNASFPNLHLFYKFIFQRGEAEYKAKQSSKAGVATMYEHEIVISAPALSMLQAQWGILVDTAGSCCGVGAVIILNTGKILIAGEKIANYQDIVAPMHLYQDGTTSTSGKKFDDLNGTTVTLKGIWSQPLKEYKGAASSFITVNPFG